MRYERCECADFTTRRCFAAKLDQHNFSVARLNLMSIAASGAFQAGSMGRVHVVRMPCPMLLLKVISPPSISTRSRNGSSPRRTALGEVRASSSSKPLPLSSMPIRAWLSPRSMVILMLVARPCSRPMLTSS